MSSCEKCWRDSMRAENSDGECGPTAYHRLLAERKGNPCTPEEQAGPDAARCPQCKRMALHQYTGECMAGCKQLTPPAESATPGKGS